TYTLIIFLLFSGYGKFGSVDRRKEWDNFVSWADAKGINHESVYLCKCDDSDEYGLKAKRDIKENDLMLKVPREAMMTVDEAMNTKLGPLIKADPILQHMPNVVLTLFLLFELSNSSSPFLPYLKILPSKYKTVLYFSANDLELLKSSPVLGKLG
ncbi:SETD3 (predicted), partial [Pycnogonum litorale]